MQLVRLAVIAFVSAAWLPAQQPAYTLRVDVPLVSLEVAVFDLAGHPLTTLTKEDFHVYENDTPQDIRNFAPVTTPYNILLLFDRSGSTEGRWPLMQHAVFRFLENLRPQDQIAIAAFDDQFDMLVDWTGNRSQAARSLNQLVRPKARGGTDFYSSIDRAARKEFSNVKGRKAVVVFSDGRDTGLYRRTLNLNRVPGVAEDREFQKTLRDVRQSETPVYFVAVNTDRNLGSGLEAGNDYTMLTRIFPRSTLPHEFLIQVRERMEQLAENSGGRIFFPTALEDVVSVYDQISRELSYSYSLGYAPLSVTGNEKYRRIEVRVRDGNRVWQSRSGYFPQR